ncbi:MAG: hypothetical protein ACR2MG_14905 [Pyrinomonadaceae bacterium]
MCCRGFVKRVVPFFLTFAVGLFIASFFVSISAPNFQFRRDFRNHREYHRTMESKIQRLSEENSRLKRELSERDKREMTNYAFENDFDIPPRVKNAPYPGR